MELIAPMLDNALAENWMASADNGTPGKMNSLMVSVPEQALIEQVSFSVSPNPMTSSSTIYINTDRNIQYGELHVYNTFGVEVRRLSNIFTNQVKVKRNGLSEGLYLFQFVANDGELKGSGKLMIK